VIYIKILEEDSEIMELRPCYYGHNSLPLGVTNAFGLELNIYHPTVASSFIHSVKTDTHGNKCILYKNGDKDLYLEYQEMPEFFRYHSDAYMSVYAKFYGNLSVADYVGFYNLVTTKMRNDFSFVQNVVVPLPVEVRNYYVEEYESITTTLTHMEDDGPVEYTALVSKGHVFHVVKRFEARENREIMCAEIAKKCGLKILYPSRVEKNLEGFYTVGGSTGLYHYVPKKDKDKGFRNEIYSNYEIIPSSVIFEQQCHVVGIPYISRVDDNVRGKRPVYTERYLHRIKNNGQKDVRYLVESFENNQRTMIDPLDCYWYEHDGTLRVVFKEHSGSFVGVEKYGDSPLDYSNPILKTYIEPVAVEGERSPNIRYPKFLHALSGTYQEHYMWMEHRMEQTGNSLVPSLAPHEKLEKYEDVDYGPYDFLNSIYDDPG